MAKQVKNQKNDSDVEVPMNKAQDDATYPTSRQRAILRHEKEDAESLAEEEKHASRRPTEESHPQAENVEDNR